MESTEKRKEKVSFNPEIVLFDSILGKHLRHLGKRLNKLDPKAHNVKVLSQKSMLKLFIYLFHYVKL